MKKVNWTEVTQLELSKNCLWTKENDVTHSEDLFAGLAENFSTKPAKKINAFSAVKSNISLRVLDLKSAQNLLILLRVQYKKTSFEQISKYILDCNDSMLSVDFIECLIKSLPQEYALKQLSKLKENNIELADVEKFLAALCGIERLLPRLQCIKFKIRFDDMVSGLKPALEAGIAACEEVIASQKLHKILKLILSVGNMMNYGSCIGKAVGFELSILPKLDEIKASDNKSTLLLYLVQLIKKNDPELLGFGKELNNVNRAARINVDNIKERIEEAVALSKNLKTELENGEGSRLSDDKFVEVMTPFSLQCHDELELLTKLTNQMQNIYKKVGDFYAFKVNKYPMDKCFSHITTFKDMFKKASTEHVKFLHFKETNKPSANRQQQQDQQQEEVKSTTTGRKEGVCHIKIKRLTKEGSCSS